jgi:D-glycero-D-manno-heptose 1,7-bisphosphate phosphatase
MNNAVFLDRDGVIIENVESYVRSWEDVQILPGVLEALTRLNSSTYVIIFVTNQSAVGRGIIPLFAAEEINNRLVRLIQQSGGRVDGIFMCPHAPEEDCSCRKPRPGLLLQASAQLAIDLSNSVFVGDALTDIQAGQSAGIKTNILVLTGRGRDQNKLPAAQQIAPFLVYNNLNDVIDKLLSDLPAVL